MEYLKEVLDSHYNRSDVKRLHRSVLFFIQNTVTGNQSLYEIDRIAKHSAALRCIEKKCRARLSIEHDIQTEPLNKGRVIVQSQLIVLIIVTVSPDLEAQISLHPTFLISNTICWQNVVLFVGMVSQK